MSDGSAVASAEVDPNSQGLTVPGHPRLQNHPSGADPRYWRVHHRVTVAMGIEDAVLTLPDDLDVLETQRRELAQSIFRRRQIRPTSLVDDPVPCRVISRGRVVHPVYLYTEDTEVGRI